MKILYIAPVRDFSGYATAARGYVQALDQAGADITVRAIRYDQADLGTGYECSERERELLKRPLDNIDVVIQHTTPNECRPVDGKVNIAVVAWETTRIPQYWVDKLNRFNSVITFCQASVDAFNDCGVTVPIFKIPHTFDIPSYDLKDVEPIVAPSAPNILKDRFIFYNISQFATKKGVDILLRSYFGAFHGKGEEVMLILKTYVNMVNREAEYEKLSQYINSVRVGMRLPMEGYPQVMLVTKTLTDEQIKKLHATGDVYVCSSRGEGWCIPAFEALAYGKKLITTLWGGMGEFARKIDDDDDDDDDDDLENQIKPHAAFFGAGACRENVYPVDYSIEPLVGQMHDDPEIYTGHDLIAEPSVCSMIQKMKLVFDNRTVKPAPDMMEFDHSVVGSAMLKVIEEVASKTLEVSNV